MADATTKICRKCGRSRPIGEYPFHNDRAVPRRHARCKKCRLIDLRRDRYRREYGITVGEYSAMLGTQGGCCALCRRPPFNRRLDIDHDHVTGKIRGLLCAKCNKVLGLSADNPTLLRLMAEYLETK